MTQEIPLKRSPLHAFHVEEGGRLVPFAGWEMPVQFKGIAQEHHAVRQKVGVFDISHMGEFLVKGPQATAWLNSVFSNQVEKLKNGEGQYTLFLNEKGGVIDDLIIYRETEESYFLVVNASMIQEVWSKLNELRKEGVNLVNLSDSFGALAIQGPLSRKFLQLLFPWAVFPEKNHWLKYQNPEAPEDGESYVCGTGYTGEEGFEIFVPSEVLKRLYPEILETLRSLEGEICGLGARDSLRLEMGYPLNGNDLTPEKTALEAGLGFFVDLSKADFCGKGALVEQKAQGVPTRLVGFMMDGTSPPPRAHYLIYHEDKQVGEICSGGLSPSLAKGIGMAYLPTGLHQPGVPLQIEIRGKRYPATTVRKPFFSKTSS